jgi:hypothetical protein
MTQFFVDEVTDLHVVVFRKRSPNAPSHVGHDFTMTWSQLREASERDPRLRDLYEQAKERWNSVCAEFETRPHTFPRGKPPARPWEK